MSTEKVLLSIKPDEHIIMRENDMNIYVRPYISLGDKITISQIYMDTLFKDGDISSNYVSANYMLKYGIIEACTNIDRSSEDIVDMLVGDGKWNEIKEKILDYEEFVCGLDTMVEMHIARNSIGGKLNDLIDQASNFLFDISQMDLSENGIKQLAKQFGELQRGVNELQSTLGREPEPQPAKKKRGRPPKKKVDDG